MLSDATIDAFEEAVRACDEARSDLEDALGDVDVDQTDDEARLEPVAAALERWRDGQRAFMSAVDESEAPDVATAAMLLQMNQGIDAANARRGIPGVPVQGTDQPFDVDLTGPQGTALTNAAMRYVSAAEDD